MGNAIPESTAEWNFWVDPEAARIVLTEMLCPVVGVTWEAALFAVNPISPLIYAGHRITRINCC